MSPTESYASLSPTASSCLLYSPSFSLSSSSPPPPPLGIIRSSSANYQYYSNLSPSGNTAINPGLTLSPPSYLVDDYGSYSPSPPPGIVSGTTPGPSNIQFSPTIRDDDFTSSEDDDDDDDEDTEIEEDDDAEICSIAQKILPIGNFLNFITFIIRHNCK